MVDFLIEVGLFAAKATTLVLAIIATVAAILGMASRGRMRDKGHLSIKKLNQRFASMKESLQRAVLSKKEAKRAAKAALQATNRHQDKPRKRLYVVDFDGDLRASAVTALREEVTAILTVATPQDEVVVRLESGGGLVHAYGLAASQLVRLRSSSIPLTVIVDKVAASGGYLMACVANRLIAAPFALVGSIGVVMQLPNFHRWLQKNDVDLELLTAGEHKRTLTLFGENTEEGRHKAQEDIDTAHDLFKRFIAEHRPQVRLDEVATGEHWFGRRALALNLVDSLGTSDDYLLSCSADNDIYQVTFKPRTPLAKKLAELTDEAASKLLRIGVRHATPS